MTLVDIEDDEEKFPSREVFIMQVAAKAYPNLSVLEAYNKILNDRKSYNKLVKDYDEWTNPASKSETQTHKIFVHCPACGYGFNHELTNGNAVGGGISGASAGAILGAKVGIAMGPLGAIAGTIPGAVLGGLFGNSVGSNFDNPRCPNCNTKFQIPNSLK